MRPDPPECRLCRNPITWGDATPAHKVHGRWRRGFVHRVCYVADVEARKRSRDAIKEARWVSGGKGRLFP